jgi:hypothetical protein
MLTLSANILIISLAMFGSWAFMAGLNRFWPVHDRYAKSDQIGWQLNVLGTTYAVILGFMLFTEWTGFTDANSNVEQEASALRNVYRMAPGLPSDQRQSIERLSRDYADAVINKDWPAMNAGAVPEESNRINEEMWRTVMSIKTTSVTEATAEDHSLTELATLSKHRGIRLLQSKNRLPVILWIVLLIGGILTIISVATFGSVNPRVHAIQVGSLTLLITLAMLSIADIDQPFQGWVHVSSYAFQRAQDNMRGPNATP